VGAVPWRHEVAPGGPEVGVASEGKGGRFAVPPDAYLEYAVRVDVPRQTRDEALLRLVARLTRLERLSLAGETVSDAELARTALPQTLKSLDLSANEAVTDEGLCHLRNLNELEELYLTSTGVGDRGMAFLEGLRSLKTLYLGWTRVGNEGAAHIAALESLEELDLGETALDDRGARPLVRCVRLRWLSLPSGVTEAGLAQLSALKEITTLSVAARGPLPLAPFQKLDCLHARFEAIDDGSFLREAPRLPKLTQLIVEGSGVTDATLRSLAGLQRRCGICVKGDDITAAGIRALARSLPRGSTINLRESSLDPDAQDALAREFSGRVAFWVAPRDVAAARSATRRGGFSAQQREELLRSATRETEEERANAAPKPERERAIETGREPHDKRLAPPRRRRADGTLRRGPGLAPTPPTARAPGSHQRRDARPRPARGTGYQGRDSATGEGRQGIRTE